jgi:DNA repair protein RecO (recombination protein O)
MHLSSEGIVVRHLARDEDRVLTILTREHGLITAFANKANRPRSSLAGSSELLCRSHFEIFRSRERYIVDRADSIHSFFALRERVEDLALACWFAQLMQELGPHDHEAGEYIDLLLAALYYLERQKRPHNLLKPVYELRLLTLSGYMPDLVSCLRCGQSFDSMNFSPDGSLLCDECAVPGIYALAPGVFAAMRHAIYAGPKRVFSFSLAERGLLSLREISEAFLLRQVGKTFPALEFYRSMV